MSKRLVVSVIVGTLTLLLGVRLYADQKPIDLNTIEKWQKKHTVVLTDPSGREFCSGGVVGGKIMTAAHCCAAYVWAELNGETLEGYTYSYDGVKQRPIASYELDERGNDVCAITPVHRERSPIKQGELLYIDENLQIHERTLWVITKISYVYDNPSLKYMEVQKVYRLSVWDEDTQYTLVQGEAIPGTSGSIILNSRGEYVGNLVIGIGVERSRAAIPHVFGMSLIELTQWGDTYW